MSNNKFIIDGPISYYYLVSDDNKKKILLFGDQHLPYEIIKGKSDINLLRFFKNCILLNEEKNSCLDLFIENIFISHLYDKNQDRTTYSVSNKFSHLDKPFLLQLVQRYLFNYTLQSKKLDYIKGFRCHNWDIRSILTFKEGKKITIFMHPFMIHLYEKWKDTMIKVYIKYFFDNTIQISYNIFFTKIIKLFLISDYEMHTLNDTESELIIFYNILNSFNLSENSDTRKYFSKEQFQLITRKIIKQIEKIDDINLSNKIKEFYYEKIIKLINNFFPTTIISIDYFRERIFNLLNYLLALQTDIYAISRMFRTFDTTKGKMENCDNLTNTLQNILYYGGDAHVLNIVDFLTNYSTIKFTCENFSKREVNKSSELIKIKARYHKNILFFSPFIEIKNRDYLGFTKDEMREIVNNRYFIKDKMCGNFNISSEDKTKYKYYLAKKVGAFYKYNKNEKQQFETVKNMPIIKCEYIN